MAVSLPNGSLISIASGYGASKVMSAISNATEAVATLEASHGVVENDILEVTSGWARLSGRIVRADSVSTNDVTFEDINTVSTSAYPAASGTGTVREISGWTQIAQVLNTASEGGEQQFATFQFIESAQETRIPTTRSAQGFTLTMADDPTLAGQIALAAADEDRAVRAFQIVLPSGAKLYYNGYVSFNDIPTLDVNVPMSVKATVSFVAKHTRYAS